MLGQLRTQKWKIGCSQCWHSAITTRRQVPEKLLGCEGRSRSQDFWFYLMVSIFFETTKKSWIRSQIRRQVPEKLRVWGPGGVETPSVNVPPLILLFPQDSIRQKWSSLIVTVRVREVSELLKWSGLWLYYVHSVHCTSFSNLIELNWLLSSCSLSGVRRKHMINSSSLVAGTL